jgi:REP element-mobilizing transposase RayT
MPRQPRLDAPGTLHHVIGRGIEGRKIFRNYADREDFLSRLGELCKEGSLAVYAWALMANHFHLLVKTGNQHLSKSMRKLLTGYVINFNRRHKRYGHLFQNRYKSIVCEEDPYLLELTRYIHLNPIRAGVVQDMKALSKYPWTGHSVLMDRVKRDWQETASILAYFGKRKKAARIKYEEFVKEGIAQGRRPELVGGGLIRSLGGWAEVLSVRRKGMKVSSDQRILGSSEFVEDLLSEVDEREKEGLRLSVRLRDLGLVAEEIKKGEGLGERELRSGRRQRKISRGRRLFCQLAVGKMGYPGTEVAMVLGVSTSAVIRAAYSMELPEFQKYL